MVSMDSAVLGVWSTVLGPIGRLKRGPRETLEADCRGRRDRRMIPLLKGSAEDGRSAE